MRVPVQDAYNPAAVADVDALQTGAAPRNPNYLSSAAYAAALSGSNIAAGSSAANSSAPAASAVGAVSAVSFAVPPSAAGPDAAAAAHSDPAAAAVITSPLVPALPSGPDPYFSPRSGSGSSSSRPPSASPSARERRHMRLERAHDPSLAFAPPSSMHGVHQPVLAGEQPPPEEIRAAARAQLIEGLQPSADVAAVPDESSRSVPQLGEVDCLITFCA